MAANLAKNTFYLTLAAIGQKVLAFIYFALIARMVGVEWTGKYFLALSFTTIFSIFVDFGLNSVLIRETARDHSLIPKYLNNIFSIKLFMAAATAIVAAVVINIMGYDSLTTLLVYLALLVMVADSFHMTFYGIFRGLKILSYEALGIFICEIIIVGLGTASLLIHRSLPILILALLAGSLFHIIYVLFLLKKRAGILPRWELDFTFLRKTFKIALPFAIAGVSVKIYSYIDSILLSLLAGDAYVGWYSIAYKLTYAFQFIPMAFVAGLYPVLSEHWKFNREKLIHTFTQSVRYMSAISIPICFGVWALADKIVIAFYGPDFFNSILPLQILIFVLFAIFVDFPVGSLLNACDRQTTKTAIMIATMVINVALNAILVPRFFAVGAAISGLISFTFMAVAGIYYGKKYIGFSLRPIFSCFIKTFLSGLVMAIVILALKEQLHFILLVPLGAIVYFLVLYIVRGWDKNDVKEITGLLFNKNNP
ncbi:MAG: flippase [Patescibacteria group bacterium]|nr:flippase [Patescibacteria group bacterium]